MHRSRLRHVLMESGLCIDRVQLLDWILAKPWRRVLAFRFLRMRFSPAILKDALEQDVPLGERGRLFSLGMSYLNVGDTYKTTGGRRTERADEEILRLAGEIQAPVVMEIGVSDGSSSQTLLEGRDVFGEVHLTDRFCSFYRRDFGLGSVFLDSEKQLLGIKILCFYVNIASDNKRPADRYDRVETVNPVIADTYGVDSIECFDMLRDVYDRQVHLIKCSNVLNPAYFSEADIRQAVDNLSRWLVDGGAVVISQNNEKYVDGEAVFIVRKRGDELVLESSINDHDAVGFFSEPVAG